MNYLTQIAIALAQLLNVLIPGGWADETISSRCYRAHLDRRAFGFMRKAIDILFFFDPEHCHKAYLADFQNRQLKPEYRDILQKGSGDTGTP